MSSIFGYYITRDDGIGFDAEVRDVDGKTVYEIKDGKPLENDETGFLHDGWIQGKNAVGAIRAKLVNLRLIPVDAEVLSASQFDRVLAARPPQGRDPTDSAAAQAYAATTGQLFVAGSIDEAFGRWRADPSGGGRAEYAHVTPKQWVVHMFGLRDRHGAFLYPRWSWPASMGNPVSPPYDYNDQDAAVYYSQATNRLFAAGKIDEAYEHWRNDPCGGAALAFCGWTKEEFAEAFYAIRDVQGNYVHSRPEELPQAITEDITLDDLHELMTQADEHYQRELERVYGKHEAGDARYLAQHSDAEVQAAKLSYHAASETWHAAMESERANLHP